MVINSNVRSWFGVVHSILETVLFSSSAMSYFAVSIYYRLHLWLRAHCLITKESWSFNFAHSFVLLHLVLF